MPISTDVQLTKVADQANLPGGLSIADKLARREPRLKQIGVVAFRLGQLQQAQRYVRPIRMLAI